MINILENLDDKIIFVEKPYGMSVHNEPGKDLQSLLEKQLGKKIHLVHRIDKETSGLVCIALDAKSAAEFAEMYQSKTIKKMYTGLCRGRFKENQGQMNFAISDKAEGRKNPQGLAKDRKESLTEYEVIKSNDYFSLVSFRILSGRQHQIRKHCALLRHPLLNDPRYNDEKYNERMQSIYTTSRMMLHASAIEFERSGTKHKIVSQLPDDFNLASFFR